MAVEAVAAVPEFDFAAGSPGGPHGFLFNQVRQAISVGAPVIPWRGRAVRLCPRRLAGSVVP